MTNTGVLVRTGVLSQIININASLACVCLFIVNANDYAGAIDTLDYAAAECDFTHAGIGSDIALHTRADQRLLGLKRGHSLTLHVRAHECAVRIVVFEEGNQCGSDGHHLLRRNVHVIHFFSWLKGCFTFEAHGHEVVYETTFLIQRRTRLSNHKVAFIDSGEIIDLVGDFVLNYFTVRTF